MLDLRPDPDSLLVQAEREQRRAQEGRLKIFFGAAAGVGKTYAMLVEAHERRAAGDDIVVGYVEAHDRPRTQALLAGLEVLPVRTVDHRGIRLQEFDLDAALARHPAVVLVDELAHTNAEGLRHAKRWQDVFELLAAGIDVYSTLNVQHIESLNDVIAQITGVTVRETIPDSVIDRADEIELIDLPPDDLLQRLREGKVYGPEQAARAVHHFFRKDALTALRELSLRCTAERVNKQARVASPGQSPATATAARVRLLVSVGPSPLSARIVRTTRRMAASLHCEWVAVSVETPGMSVPDRARSARHLRLAESLGAESTTLAGERVADEIIAYSRRHAISCIVIGKPAVPRWRDWLYGSIVSELIRLSDDIDVFVIKGDASPAVATDHTTRSPTLRWREYGLAALVVACCTVCARAVSDALSPVNLTMLYLVGVVFVSTRAHVGAAALTAFFSALSFNFFFTEPYFSFAIRDVQYVITFLALLITGLIVSGLTQRVRRQSDAVRDRYRRTAALYAMSRHLADAADPSDIIRAACHDVSCIFNTEAVVLRPGRGDELVPAPGTPAWLTPHEIAAARWVYDQQQSAGCGTDTLPGCNGLYVPLVATGPTVGVLGLHQAHALLRDTDQRDSLDACVAQLSTALERADLARQAASASVAAQTAQTRNTLLSSVSHDLRTPLATITGSASALQNSAAHMSEAVRSTLLASIQDESRRMNTLIGKLLDMTRIESPGFAISREWFPLHELVGAALTSLESRLTGHRVETAIPPDLMVHVDGLLLGQVLTNLLDNAVTHTPAGTHITVRAFKEEGCVRVEVADNGPGLPHGLEGSVFEKFVRSSPRHDRASVGLGLAICRAIIRLHDGRIDAYTPTSGGACFWFEIPQRAIMPTAGADA